MGTKEVVKINELCPIHNAQKDAIYIEINFVPLKFRSFTKYSVCINKMRFKSTY